MASNCRFAFAVHVLSVLALKPGEPYTSERLAETVNTNPVVIRRLLLDLRAGGLVETHRGPGGGSLLSRPAGEINLAQVHEAVQGEFRAFGEHPNQPDKSCPVGREIERVMDGLAERASLALRREYESLTLADVLRQIQKENHV